MRAEHINITIPSELRDAVDREAKGEHTKRSTFIQKAVRVYLVLSRRKAIRELLAEGYAELAHDAKQLQREFRHLDQESLKYVD